MGGHGRNRRIRIAAITSSAAPAPQVSLYRDRTHPSFVTLPVIAAK